MGWINELWIMVVGGDDDDERLIAKSNDMFEIRKAIEKYEDEVMNGDMDKYFELSTNHQAYTFTSLEQFDSYGFTTDISRYVGALLGL